MTKNNNNLKKKFKPLISYKLNNKNKLSSVLP